MHKMANMFLDFCTKVAKRMYIVKENSDRQQFLTLARRYFNMSL